MSTNPSTPGRDSNEQQRTPGTEGNDQQNATFDNPQEGKEWSNYQTRELAGEEGESISAEEAAKVFDKEEE